MAKEVEKKFKLNLSEEALKKILAEAKSKRIEQTYLKLDSIEVQEAIKKNFPEVTEGQLINIKEARYRQKGEGEKAKYYFTLKSGGGMERDEYETDLSGENLAEIRLLTKNEINSNGEVFKTRYEVKKESNGQILIIEIDLYDGKLTGLVSAEIEFDPELFSEKEIDQIIKEIDAEAEDVTESKVYKNKELAKINSLEELCARRAQELQDKQQKIPLK